MTGFLTDPQGVLVAILIAAILGPCFVVPLAVSHWLYLRRSRR